MSISTDVVARRTDAISGHHEEASFVGSGPDRLFSTLHSPNGEPFAGVVVCPSVMSELLANYANEVALGRRLAAAGIAVRRFHYRGTGHSDGDTSSLDFESMVEDALAVADRVAGEAHTDRICFVGTRVGGLVAAAAASRRPGAPLCLWDPFTTGARFFRELVRTLAVLGVSGESGAPRTIEEFALEVHASGYMDVAGYPIHETLYDTLEGRSLAELASDGPREVLLVQLGRRDGVREDLASVVREWSARGMRVEVASIEDRISWWFHRPVIPAVEKLSSLTGAWLEDRWSEGASS